MSSLIAGWAFPTAKWKVGSPPRALPMPAAKPSRRRAKARNSPSSCGWPLPRREARKKPHERDIMSLADLITDPTPITVSFEFSPPKTEESEANLWTAIRRLEPLAPSFVSVTYGAGGSTRERTHATVKRIVEETTLKPAAHLTCAGHSRREIDEIGRSYWDAGIRHLVALRGDMPGMSGPYRAHQQGYASTPELIEGLRQVAPFEISVSCYPECH